MATKYTFTDSERQSIEKACKQVRDPWTLRRLKVLWFRALGKSYPQITREVGYSPSQITRLIRDYQEYGLDAFIAMPHTGKRKYATHKSNFTPERVAELKHRYKTATTKGEARRFKVLLLRSEGYTLKDCALKAGITEAHTFRLVRAYRQNGISAILEKPCNHASKIRNAFEGLTEQQRAELQNIQETVTDELAVTRLKIIQLRAEHKNYKQIMEATGASKPLVSRVLRRYVELGLQAVLEDGRTTRHYRK